MSKSVYELVTKRVIEELEKGFIPWEKPFTGTQSGAFNRISQKPYSLLNQMILKHSGEYATMKQWNELGGKIKKGSKSEFVCFWKISETEVKKDDGTTEKKQVAILRYYNVFHISQVEGVEPLKREVNKIETDTMAENIINDYLIRESVRYEQTASDKAYYSPLSDLIHLPLLEQFKSKEEYYSTLFHEVAHSTGHKSRLNRLHLGIDASFGSATTYSKEELIAEISSASLMNVTGLENKKSFTNSSAYIQNWIKVLKNDTRFIVSATSKAEKAVKYILNEH